MKKDVSNITYEVNKDLSFYLETKKMSLESFCAEAGLAKQSVYALLNGRMPNNDVLEKIYGKIYEDGYRINSVKAEVLGENAKGIILFHGSKQGLSFIDSNGSRNNCDFGRGFYLGESYEQALAFIDDQENGTVYSFELFTEDLKIKKLELNMEWLLTICHYRGYLGELDGCDTITVLSGEIDDADVVIAPIADNRMFYIMNRFAKGEINSEVALHALAASKLGDQYVIKSNNALQQLKAHHRYYLCNQEKKAAIQRSMDRVAEIDTKLKLAQREYKTGLFIEEMLYEGI